MKKYLPSMDELVSGVVVIIVGLTVWSFVQPMIAKLTAKITPSTAAWFMRDANGITLEVGQSVTFHTWDETDPVSPVRVPQTGVIKKLSGEVARNQTLGEVTLQSGETLAALAVSVVTDPAPAAPSAPAKRKNPSKRK